MDRFRAFPWVVTALLFCYPIDSHAADRSLKTQALQGCSPDEMLSHVNTILFPDNDNCMFTTVFCAILDARTGELEFANAGHNPPLLRRRDAAFEFMSPGHGPPLAIREDAKFPLCRTRLDPRDAILLYTDGVTEAINPETEMFSDERLRETLGSLRGRDMRGVIFGIQAAVKEFARGAPQFDDITMLAVDFHGPAGGLPGKS